MDTIILPDFSLSTVNSFVKYFYSGETYINDRKSLNEFLVLCEIFKFNVIGMEVTDMKLTEDALIVSDGNFVDQTDEMLNEDTLQEEIFESIDMAEIGDEENQHVEQLEELENEEITGNSYNITSHDHFGAATSSVAGGFDNSSFISISSKDILQGTLKDIKSRRLNLIQNKYESPHSSQADNSSQIFPEQTSVDDSNVSVPTKRNKTSR